MNSKLVLINAVQVLPLILLLLLIILAAFLVALQAHPMMAVLSTAIIQFITRGDLMRSFLINLLLASISLLILSWLAMTAVIFSRTGVI